MIKNYLIANVRNLWKNRSHSAINLIGLALGITCSIIIFLIIRFETTFDNYHANKDRIYRVVTEFTGTGEPGYSSGITYPLVPAIRNDFPDPEHVVLVDANLGDPVITVTKADGRTDRFKEKQVVFVEPQYFEVFTYQFVEGNQTALQQGRSVVISESLAKKYFGSVSAVGKVLNYANEFDVTVTGVVANPPLNTDLPFQIFLSMKGNEKRGWDNWGAMSSSINCYVLLREGTSKNEFDKKLKGWHQKYFTGENEEDGKRRTYFLQPLKDIHFDTRFGNFSRHVVSINSLLTLSLIGLLLLLTACINFINLNTVLIINRSKEAGIRKVMGSTKMQLVWQFLAETLLITLVATLMAAGLVELAIIFLPVVLGYNLTFDPLADPATFLFVATLPLIVTILAGLYPASKLSRFQPVQALKNKLGGAPGQGLTLRRALIVFQLVISQALVVCTIIAIQQLRHFMDQPLGINTEAIIEFELPENNNDLDHKDETIHILKDRLLNIPGIVNVSMSNTGSTSGNQWAGDFEATVAGQIIKENASVKYADHDFIETYGIKLLHGEDLLDTDTATRFVVNESFARAIGFENSQDVIGIPVNMWGSKAMITGIMNDFNTESLHSAVSPAIVMCGVGAYYVGAVKLQTNDTRKTIAEIQSVWEEVYPKFVFEYKFLDDTIAEFYDSERRSSYLIGAFASVAILIGCIGLYGLVSFMARMKTKEVGIRKTLGASVVQVIGLFSKEFIVLVTISFVISVPIAWYFMNEWLQNFAYRISPGPSTFLLGVGLTMLVVMATVGIKSYKAAIANPVDALKDE